jgi:two-component system cell cycle sensor histidine kinase/response regulator CckA
MSPARYPYGGGTSSSGDSTKTHPLELSALSGRAESLGLTAGVAHDFNNLLLVVIGQVEIAQTLLPPGHPAATHLLPALQAAERAAGLARSLLTSAKQTTTGIDFIDLNTVVGHLEMMLRPAMGDDVEIEIVPGSGLRGVRADPAQMEQLLLNLALNARDAMPEGGRLRIETRNVETSDDQGSSANHLVLLLVSDNGVGMDAATKRRIFEPFFTTKASGLGFGLGLAVDSAPGHGTTFRFYLPCSDAPVDAPGRESFVAGLPGGTETILIVEDSEPVREVTRALLADLGYDVLTSCRGEEAVALARSHRGAIHLLLTDLVMPGVPGRDVAGQFSSLRPATRCLFMSGYSDDAVVVGSPVLPKPADRRRLAFAVREALDDARPVALPSPPQPKLDMKPEVKSVGVDDSDKA